MLDFQRMPELREQIALPCGCTFLRDHSGGAISIDVLPCDEHETLSWLPPRQYGRYIGWPPTAVMVERAASRGKDYAEK